MNFRLTHYTLTQLIACLSRVDGCWPQWRQWLLCICRKECLLTFCRLQQLYRQSYYTTASNIHKTCFLSPRSIPIVILFIAGSPLFLQHYDCVSFDWEWYYITARGRTSLLIIPYLYISSHDVCLPLPDIPTVSLWFSGGGMDIDFSLPNVRAGSR